MGFLSLWNWKNILKTFSELESIPSPEKLSSHTLVSVSLEKSAICEEEEYRDYLQDILNSLDEIKSFTENMNFDSFARDKKTIYAVIRCPEVIGEATKKPETSQ